MKLRLILFTISILTINIEHLWACGCISTFNSYIADVMLRADKVFAAKVIAVRPDTTSLTGIFTTLRVVKAWKGTTEGQFINLYEYDNSLVPVPPYIIRTSCRDPQIASREIGSLSIQVDTNQVYILSLRSSNGRESIGVCNGYLGVWSDYDAALLDKITATGATRENVGVSVYPNPANGTTTFALMVPEWSFITVEVVNMLGQIVATLVTQQIRSAGFHELQFETSGLLSGVCFCRVRMKQENNTEKIAVRKFIVL